MSIDRKARIANGCLVLGTALLALLVNPQFIWLTLFMGVSLIFSGATGFCGFRVIFEKLGAGG
jgi:hypothetical protein